jgi:hypothetical protein
MKKLLTILLVSLLGVALLVACTPPLTRGYVYDKQYQAAYMQYIPGYTTESCTKVGKYDEECDSVYHPGYTIWHPEHYYLELTSCSTLQTDGQCQTGEVEVDQNTYDGYRIGSYYPG